MKLFRTENGKETVYVQMQDIMQLTSSYKTLHHKQLLQATKMTYLDLKQIQQLH